MAERVRKRQRALRRNAQDTKLIISAAISRDEKMSRMALEMMGIRAFMTFCFSSFTQKSFKRLCGRQNDAESASFSLLRLFDKDLPVVVVFDYAFRERKPEAPAPFLGTEAGIEDFLEF